MANEIANKVVIQTTGLLNVSGKKSIINTGTMKAGTLTVVSDEKISNSYCAFWVLCNKGTMSADKISITVPKIKAISDLDGNYTAQVPELNQPAAIPATDTSL